MKKKDYILLGGNNLIMGNKNFTKSNQSVEELELKIKDSELTKPHTIQIDIAPLIELYSAFKDPVIKESLYFLHKYLDDIQIDLIGVDTKNYRRGFELKGFEYGSVADQVLEQTTNYSLCHALSAANSGMVAVASNLNYKGNVINVIDSSLSAGIDFNSFNQKIHDILEGPAITKIDKLTQKDINQSYNTLKPFLSK